MARTILCEGNLPKYFWIEVVNTACYILNRILIHPILKKTPYELWNDKKPNISYFHVLGCKCFVHNNGKDNLGKFDSKADDAIFLGYSLYSKAYRVFNKRTFTVEESIHVVFIETNPTPSRQEKCIDNDVGTLQKGMDDLSIQDKDTQDGEETVSKYHTDLPRDWRYVTSHPKELIIEDPLHGVRTTAAHDYLAFVSQIEPHSLEEAETDPN